MIKTIYSAKPHKYGYKITRYLWQDNHYKDIKGITFLADKESATAFLNGIKNTAEQSGLKTETEQTIKWYFLTINGEFEI